MEAASTKLVIEMAFTLEGSTAEELPERALGSVRLSKVDLAEDKTRTPDL
ncbi:hypothetical protein BVRB_041990 [Beta vulgaris subsp. vulgaris]|uniref:Protein ENHANCED DISEASE RESISTANCE 2 C-terminal domain-containing protein n=1 Tax=Beta vulgaris subsp. vulgaris TaxID=3555 RepID=A0A0J7YMM6_BETVV|nr:hypothetical protein BVRB_041990 [Beta vulgaris subsp. vulgaris]